jgi:hypothetical protein
MGLLADLSTRLTGLAASQVGPEIDRALERLLDHLGTDRISLIELREEDESLFVAHSGPRASKGPP